MYGWPLLSKGGMFQDPPECAETSDGTKPYIYWFFFYYKYVPMIKFNF